MNSTLSAFARRNLRDNLALCTAREQLLFKRMYSHLDLDKPINDVVDAMPDEKLDWAMQQVQRTVDKRFALTGEERGLQTEERIGKRIWKYEIRLAERQSVEMPSGAKVLFVGVQVPNICLWAEVDPEAEKQIRLVSVFGTGHPMPDDPGSYIGTFMLHGGALVFHVYDAGS